MPNNTLRHAGNSSPAANSKRPQSRLRISERHVREYSARGLTLQALANHYGASVSKVWRELKHMGVSRRSRRGRPANRERHLIVIALAREGFSRREIADQLSISPEWVRQILNENGMVASLTVLKCRNCGSPIATGHKTYQPRFQARMTCLPCIVRKARVPFAERLRAYRLAMNMSLAQLSQRSGLSRAALGKYENGFSTPTWRSVQKLAKGIGIPVGALTARTRALVLGAPGISRRMPKAV